MTCQNVDEKSDIFVKNSPVDNERVNVLCHFFDICHPRNPALKQYRFCHDPSKSSGRHTNTLIYTHFVFHIVEKIISVCVCMCMSLCVYWICLCTCIDVYIMRYFLSVVFAPRQWQKNEHSNYNKAYL